MAKMKKRKGLTLIEVIISLIILTIIATTMLSYFSTGFDTIFKLRDQNRINFDIQKSFEERLAKIKKDGGTGTDIETFRYTINGRSGSVPVKGTTLSYDDKVKKIRLFVSNQKESVLDIPEEKDLTVTVDKGKRYYYVGETVPNGTVLIKNSYKSSVKMYTEPGWFLSNREVSTGEKDVVVAGTSAKSRNGVPETASKVVYPKLMTDFTQLSKKQSGFTIEDSMRGKYLVFAGRAINSYGRIGAYQEAEDRMWVMGIPVVEDLHIHTDVDLALQNNNGGTASAVATTGVPINDILIRNYKDNDSNSKYRGTIPVQSQYEDSLGQARQFIAFAGSNMYFSNNNTEAFTTAILIGNKRQSGKLLAYTPMVSRDRSSMEWSLNLDENGGVSINLNDPSGLNRNLAPVESVATIDYSKDHSFQVRSSRVNGQNQLRIEVFLDQQTRPIYNKTITYSGRGNNGTASHSINNTTIYFGGNTYINELAMYRRALGNDDISRLADYFDGKYKTDYNAS